MRRFGQIISLSCAFLFVAGCQTPPGPRVVDRLPDPLIDVPYRARPRAAKPATPKVKPRVARRNGESGWMPARGMSSHWRYIIIHHSATDRGTPQGIDSYHRQRGWDELGYHFVIGNGVGYPDGKIFVGSRWPKQKYGAHTRVKRHDDNRWNKFGIGICLIGNFERSRPSRKQIESCARLVKFLSKACRIPAGRVYGHGDVDPHTKCPGRHLAMSRIKTRIAVLLREERIYASSN
ncbi:MAG: peptidoglycan recognition family protein [Phycisphaerae bacterium]